MSCWVVPAIAAEFWGVTLDVVWNRVTSGLVPQKTESGFVFIDLYPWTPAIGGAAVHTPPATFVPVLPHSALLTSPGELEDPDTEDAKDLAPRKEESEDFAHSENISDDNVDSEAPDPVDDELPALNDEEEATFGRLTWQETRQKVSLQRRAPTRSHSA